MATYVNGVVMVTGEPESELWQPGLWALRAACLKETSICFLVQAGKVMRMSTISQQGVACGPMQARERWSQGLFIINILSSSQGGVPGHMIRIPHTFMCPHTGNGRITAWATLQWRNHEPLPGILLRWKLSYNVSLHLWQRCPIEIECKPPMWTTHVILHFLVATFLKS